MNRYRHEYKYLIDAQQEAILRIQAAGVLEPDSHIGPEGTYRVRSLYFDDIDDSCFYANESGTDPRAKFRIRYYNADPAAMQLEKKSKCRGMTLKESAALTPDECRRILDGKNIELSDDMPALKKKLLSELDINGMAPKVIVTYLRYPFVYSAGNVRVTFDEEITSSNDLCRFLSGNYEERPILGPGLNVLEVKWDEVLPQHIREALYTDHLRWSSFSKYYLCRRYHL